MSKIDIDISKADKNLIIAYENIYNAIHTWSKAHPKKLTEEEHQVLRKMLAERAEALSKMLASAAKNSEK